MHYIRLLLITSILTTVNNCFAQSKAIADSCKDVLFNDKSLNDSLRFDLMVKITFNQVNPDSILFYADQLIEVAKKKTNTMFIAKAYYFKSLGYSQKSKNDIALELLIKCINEASKIKNERIISTCHFQMGNIYSSLKNYDNSIACYLTAIKKFRKLKCTSELSSAYLNLGTDYYAKNKLDSALHYYSFSDSLYSTTGNEISGAYVKGNIGIILAKQKKNDLARLKLSDAFNILNKAQHHQAAVTYKLWLCVIEQNLRNYSSALILANECLITAKENNIKDQIRDSYDELSTIYELLGRYEDSNIALKQYYAYRDSIVNTETITKMANLRTEFEVGQKQAELDAMAENERFKTLIAWILLVALSSVAVLLVIVYRHNRHNKRLLAQLKIQKAELELANETKNRFFSVISHDLRGPMGAIGNLVILANDALVNEQMAELRLLLNMMGDNSREVETLLNNLLHWSVGQRGAYQKHFDTINFNQLVNNVISIYTPIAIAKGIELTFLPSQPSHWVVTDPNSWAVIVRNLVNNAIKFTHTGGKVEITVSQQDNLLVLQVSDTGIGMEASVAENLFKSAVNLPQWGTNYEKGMGIGLSLIKDFVDINEGKIEVASVLGKGTVFTVMIPVGAATQTISDRNESGA